MIYQTLYAKQGDSFYVILFSNFQEIVWTFVCFLQESDKYKKTDIRLAIFSYFKVLFLP